MTAILLAAVTLTLLPVSSFVLDRNFYWTLASDTRVYELWQAQTLLDYFAFQGNANVDTLPGERRLEAEVVSEITHWTAFKPRPTRLRRHRASSKCGHVQQSQSTLRFSIAAGGGDIAPIRRH